MFEAATAVWCPLPQNIQHIDIEPNVSISFLPHTVMKKGDLRRTPTEKISRRLAQTALSLQSSVPTPTNSRFGCYIQTEYESIKILVSLQ